MPIAVTGSIATDHLMTYAGKFEDSLVEHRLDKLSLSFLVDDLEIRRGGCAANIAFGLARLGHPAVMIGAVGEDFVSYRGWLERHGVNCDHVHISETKHTARFVCTTDESMAQIATFYTGAMSEARLIELAPISRAVGGFDLVLIGPNDPEAMLRHTDECRSRGIPFAADPSQQMAFSNGADIRSYVDGATYLFCNDYEAELLQQKTGWTHDEVRSRVGTWVVTKGADGATVEAEGHDPFDVPAIEGITPLDPTGVGDAFRSGFLAAVEAGLTLERGCQVGSALAASVIETTGTQEYGLHRDVFLDRINRTYSAGAAAEIDAALTLPT